MQNNSVKKISFAHKLGYGFGNLGFGIIYQVVVSYLVFYSTAVLKLSGSLIGTIVAVGVIWDAVTDPTMGYISDNTKSKKYGRRHAYLLAGGLLSGITNCLLWVVDPRWSDAFKIIWILVVLVLVKTSLTIFSTPHSALGAELSEDYDERSSIQGIRTIFFLLGIISASVLVMLLFFKSTPEFVQGQLNPDAYPKMGAATSAIMIIASLTTFFSTKRYIPILPGPAATKSGSKALFNVIADFIQAFKNSDYSKVVIGYLFTNIVTAMVTSLGLHVFTFTFGLSNKNIAAVFAILFIMSVVSQPVWVAISKRLDKKQTIIIGLLICLASGIILLLFVIFRNELRAGILLFIPFSALMGFGSGGLYSLPMSMVADTIDIEELRTGKRTEGVYYGLLTFSYKLSQSIVIFFIGIMLDAIGFNAELAVQSEYTSGGLGLILAIGGIAAIIFGILAYRGYSLTRTDIKKVQDSLHRK